MSLFCALRQALVISNPTGDTELLKDLQSSMDQLWDLITSSGKEWNDAYTRMNDCIDRIVDQVGITIAKVETAHAAYIAFRQQQENDAANRQLELERNLQELQVKRVYQEKLLQREKDFVSLMAHEVRD